MLHSTLLLWCGKCSMNGLALYQCHCTPCNVSLHAVCTSLYTNLHTYSYVHTQRCSNWYITTYIIRKDNRVQFYTDCECLLAWNFYWLDFNTSVKLENRKHISFLWSILIIEYFLYKYALFSLAAIYLEVFLIFIIITSIQAQFLSIEIKFINLFILF